MADKDEFKIIDSFLSWIIDCAPEEFFIITKNGMAFDMPFILARLALKSYTIDHLCNNGTSLTKYDHFDLQDITEKRISLQTMAQILGCTPKSGTGMNAIKLWKQGKLKELKEYCIQDVDTTEEVFLKWKKLQSNR